MYPPHLPPPTCDVSQHRQWQRLKLIGVATFFGLLAGLSGAAVTIAFIWPNSDVTTAIVSRIPRPGGEVTLSNTTARQLNDTTFQVYRKISITQGIRHLSPADHIATAAVGVSSGWLVALIDGYDGSTSSWRVLGPNGSLYSVVRALPDTETGLVYFQIAPLRRDGGDEQYKVSQFANTLALPSVVFVSQAGSWVQSSVRTLASGSTVSTHSDLATALRFMLGGSFPNGSAVVDAEGVVLGFVANNTTVVPAVSVVTMLSGIDSRTRLSYPSIGVEGWYSEEWPLLVGNERVDGFVVSKVIGESLLKKSDIIREVNGRPMTFATWWALRNDREVTVGVLRQHQMVTLTLSR